jgi:hypothetical protein
MFTVGYLAYDLINEPDADPDFPYDPDFDKMWRIKSIVGIIGGSLLIIVLVVMLLT